jgi:hypothetical protein
VSAPRRPDDAALNAEPKLDLFTELVAKGASPALAAHVERLVEESFARRREALEAKLQAETWHLRAVALAAAALTALALRLALDLRL